VRPIRNLGSPSQGTRLRLDALKGEVDGLPLYADRVDRAKKLWGAKSNKNADEAAFDEVKRLLTAGCAGAQRCNYCEDSVADEIEHFRPKDLYPELAFSWENYLYACGPCNGPKNAKFGVFAGPADVVTEQVRGRNAPVTPPVVGTPALIDPRNEDPLDLLAIDLGLTASTFHFIARPGLSQRDVERVDYTVKTLGLNIRSYLLTARKTTYDNLIAALIRPAAQRRGFSIETEAEALRGAREATRNTPHRFVWEFMVRERARLSTVDMLLDIVPEAVGW